MNQENSAGAVVFRRDFEPKYLLLQSRKWTDWGFPKGHIEKEESTEQAAVREVLEETGLKGELIVGSKKEYEYVFEFEGKLIQKRVTFYLLETKETEVKLNQREHQSYKWVNYLEAMNTLTHKEEKELLKKANAFIISKIF